MYLTVLQQKKKKKFIRITCFGWHSNGEAMEHFKKFENVRKKQHLREILLHHYFLKKNATQAHRSLVECYGTHALSDTQCREWFRRFKNGDFDIRDKERPGQPKKFNDDELEALIQKDPSQSQEQLAAALNVTQATVSKRLKALGMIQQQEQWVAVECKTDEN